MKNRHHTALFVQKGELRLLIRKGPISSNDKTKYPSEWMWKAPQISDSQWHSYEIIVNYPSKVTAVAPKNAPFSDGLLSFQVELYIDEQLFTTNKDNFRVTTDYPLSVIPGTEETSFTLGACWHGKIKSKSQIHSAQIFYTRSLQIYKRNT